MSYKIVVDSCCELPEELKGDPRFEIVPLGIEVGDWHIQDDAGFNQAEFLKKWRNAPHAPVLPVHLLIDTNRVLTVTRIISMLLLCLQT